LAVAGFNYRKALTLFFFSINVSYNHINANNIASGVITITFSSFGTASTATAPTPGRRTYGQKKYSFALHTNFGSQMQDDRSVQLQNGAFLPF